MQERKLKEGGNFVDWDFWYFLGGGVSQVWFGDGLLFLSSMLGDVGSTDFTEI